MITASLSVLVAAFLAVGIARDRQRRNAPALAPVRAVGTVSAADVARAARIAADDALYGQWYGQHVRAEAGRHVQVIPLIRPVLPVAADADADADAVVLLDERTADVLASPELTDRDLVGVVEQVAPGVGSVVSLGNMVQDTKIRTSAEVAAVQAAEVEAYDAIEENEVRLLMAEFDREISGALRRFGLGTGRVDMWFHYEHESGHDGCPRCQAAVKENSAEHKQIVSMHDTGTLDLRDLRKLWAEPVSA